MTASYVVLLCLIKTCLFLNENLAQTAGSFCETDEECGASSEQFCCRIRPFPSRKECRRNCIGQFCANDNDCRAKNLCCGLSNRCTSFGCQKQCNTNGDCKPGKYCCRKDITQKSACLANCIGEYCRSDIDCGGPKECCSLLKHCTTYGCRDECRSNGDCRNGTVCCIKRQRFDKNTCQANCLGESCRGDGDCGWTSHCCGHRYLCTSDCPAKKELGGWIIATIFASACFLLLFTVGAVIFFVQRLKDGSFDGCVGRIWTTKEEIIDAKTRRQRTVRRPPPLPPVQNAYTTANPPDEKHISKQPPSIVCKTHNKSFSLGATLGKEQRPPPVPPCAKSTSNQGAPTLGKTLCKKHRQPPHPPGLSPGRDPRALLRPPRLSLGRGQGPPHRPPPHPPGLSLGRDPRALLRPSRLSLGRGQGPPQRPPPPLPCSKIDRGQQPSGPGVTLSPRLLRSSPVPTCLPHVRNQLSPPLSPGAKSNGAQRSAAPGLKLIRNQPPPPPYKTEETPTRPNLRPWVNSKQRPEILPRPSRLALDKTQGTPKK